MFGDDVTLERTTLSDQVEAHIRDHIVSNKIAPGESLPATGRLAEQFGVSRAIVREALKSLEAKGLITIANGKRATVNPVNNQMLIGYFERVSHYRDETLIELLELRRGLEVQSALLAARRRNAEDMGRLRTLVREMRVHKGDIEAYLDLDVQLHLAIASASRNQMLFQVLDSLRVPSRDTMKEGQNLHANPRDQEAIQRNHEILVDLIEARDAQGAAAYMAKHFDEAIESIEKSRRRARSPT